MDQQSEICKKWSENKYLIHDKTFGATKFPVSLKVLTQIEFDGKN